MYSSDELERAVRILNAAVYSVSRRYPYLHVAIVKLKFCPTPYGNAAMSRDGVYYFNPKFVLLFHEQHGVRGVEGLLLHELMHFLFRHAERGIALLGNPPTTRSWRRWDIATNLEVNSLLQRDYPMECRLPSGRIIRSGVPQEYNLPSHRVAEWYYRKLVGSDGSTESESEGAGEVGGAGGEGEGDTSEDEQFVWPSGHTEGSGADGIPREWETVSGNIREGEAEGIRARVAEEASRSKGDVAGWMKRWVSEFKRSRVNPFNLLACEIASSLSRSDRSDFSFRIPNQRWVEAMPDVARPTLMGWEPRIAFIADTSGSMGNAEIALVLGVLDTAFRTGVDEVLLVPCDAAVYEQDVVTVRSAEEAREHLRGGGGTNMSAALEYVRRLGDIDAILLMTDGYTDWPSRWDGPPVVVALTTDTTLDRVPPFFRAVVVA